MSFMSKEAILVVDDEEDIQELVRYNLQKESFDVHCVSSGEEGLNFARSKKPALVVLDLMLPGINGLDVCRLLKSEKSTAKMPIIMISAKGAEADVVAGLELGADDYLTKPFSPRILLARVRTVLRRNKMPADTASVTLSIDGLVINPTKHEVTLDGQLVDLTATEFKLLHFLASHPGWVFTRNKIVVGVHGEDYPVTDRSVDVQVVGLRKKLGEYGNLIETIRGVGYRFRE